MDIKMRALGQLYMSTLSKGVRVMGSSQYPGDLTTTEMLGEELHLHQMAPGGPSLEKVSSSARSSPDDHRTRTLGKACRVEFSPFPAR